MNTNLTQKLFKPIVEKVAIVGAGPGGLAAAIALRSQGIEVQVYEKAQEFRPAGTGLGLAPNGLHFLDAMPAAGCANAPGIVETLKSSGCEVHHTVLKSIQVASSGQNSFKLVAPWVKCGTTTLTLWHLTGRRKSGK
ncbi:NAD(P)-binding protein [Nostoc sp.]|uniref:NAD(P)-binding protein n=1 Tax=Nostoc sp. TaxID=1180 RepID=UPI002FFA00B2